MRVLGHCDTTISGNEICWSYFQALSIPFRKTLKYDQHTSFPEIVVSQYPRTPIARYGICNLDRGGYVRISLFNKSNSLFCAVPRAPLRHWSCSLSMYDLRDVDACVVWHEFERRIFTKQSLLFNRICTESCTTVQSTILRWAFTYFVGYSLVRCLA